MYKKRNERKNEGEGGGGKRHPHPTFRHNLLHFDIQTRKGNDLRGLGERNDLRFGLPFRVHFAIPPKQRTFHPTPYQQKE